MYEYKNGEKNQLNEVGNDEINQNGKSVNTLILSSIWVIPVLLLLFILFIYILYKIFKN